MPETDTTGAEVESDAEEGAFVTRSSKRAAVLARLVDGPADAATLAARDAPDIEGVSGVSRSVSASGAGTATEELRSRELVELLVDGETPIYSITAKGERVLFALERDETG